MKKILIPVVTRLHAWGAFEVMAFLVSYQVILEGCSISEELSMGLYIVITGIGLTSFSMGYSTLLHEKRIRDDLSRDMLSDLFTIWGILILIPLAIII